MNPTAKLTRRENEVGELLAWGATKKEVAEHLYISVRTVENHARNIYAKTGCNSSSEFSAWWFCTNHNISFHLSPLARMCIIVFFMLTYFFGSFNPITDKYRRIPTRTVRTRTLRNRRKETTYIFIV